MNFALLVEKYNDYRDGKSKRSQGRQAAPKKAIVAVAPPLFAEPRG
jgi:hypothetical protein